tara:strand:- start:464 stop:1252 length:789 start_codon:yes stop_codon:yes gene_type:complete
MTTHKLNQKKLILKKITKNGYCIIQDIFKKQEVDSYKKLIKKIYTKRVDQKESVGSVNNQCIYNFFYEDLKLMPLVYIKKIDSILSTLLEKNYVLQSSNAQNRLIEKLKINKKNFKIGNSWHTDSRYLNNKRISNGFSFLVIIALEDFNEKTASTQFIKNSLKSFKQPKRFKNFSFNTLKMKRGSVCIMDTGIIHRGGVATPASRWSVFNIYTPWFVKPYFNYKKLLIKKASKLKKEEKKILHFFSEPSASHNERINTITSS